MSIVCPTIEASYSKGPVDAQHPDGRWLHVRNKVDGSMLADSVANWHDAVDKAGASTGFVKGWQVNNLPFTAATSGFSGYPSTYAWSLPGLTLPEGWLTNPAAPTTNFNLIEPTANPFPKSTTLNVAVTDSGDNLTIMNTYGVTWHTLEENPHKVGPEVADDTSYGITISPAVNTLTTISIPKPHVSVELAGGAHILGGVSTGAAAGLPIVEEVLALTEPELFVGQIVLGVFGYGLGLVPDAKEETDDIPADTRYAEFKADVAHQVLINQQPVGQKDVERFYPPLSAERVYAQLQSDPANWEQDHTFNPNPLQNTLSVEVTPHRIAKKQEVDCDGYNVHGYSGQVPHPVRAEGAYYTVTHWIYLGK